MKIKFKKEMTLDELIKWAWENPELVRGEKFMRKARVMKHMCISS
ncbi:hypothetical protein ACV56Z_16015 [Staphylococcus aureus]